MLCDHKTYHVTSLQGKYLGNLLSGRNGDVLSQSVEELEGTGVTPFHYKHFGSFAYVGDNKAVLQVPIIGMQLRLTVAVLTVDPITYPPTHTHTRTPLANYTMLYFRRKPSRVYKPGHLSLYKGPLI